ncbi:MAG: alpha/beta hydrolase [Burkholderiaceae bacterium]|nr:alpha/beta hydrolase [Burkholderiaceae bacterium]
MMQPQIKMVQCLSPAGLHEVVYREWGDPANPEVLVCVHGVTRVADDFDALAAAMADRYRVICPDVVGRGRSSWLKDPKFYVVPQYVSDMVTLIARLDVPQVDWFGTSMGALIGMGLAAQQGSPIRRMVMNDVGPTLNFEALARIGDYIGQDLRFDSFAQGRDYIRTISAPFGPHTDDEWDKLARDVLRQGADGQWRRHYDPALALPFKALTVENAKQGEAAMWAAYDAIRCPVLLVRGSESDLLTRETARQMTERGPRATLVELAGIGHAPTFMHADQIALARRFFLD